MVSQLGQIKTYGFNYSFVEIEQQVSFKTLASTVSQKTITLDFYKLQVLRFVKQLNSV